MKSCEGENAKTWKIDITIKSLEFEFAMPPFRIFALRQRISTAVWP